MDSQYGNGVKAEEYDKMKSFDNSIECMETSLVSIVNLAAYRHTPSIQVKKSNIGITVLSDTREQIQVNLQFSTNPSFPAHKTFTVETPPYGYLHIKSNMIGGYRPADREVERMFYIREDPGTTDDLAKTVSILMWD